MKILVCIKQVIDTDIARPEPAGKWLGEDMSTPFRMNIYDEYALEEALLIKDGIPGTEIHAITVGPCRAAQVVKRAISKGATEGIHICCDKLPLPPRETADRIAAYAIEHGFDLIFSGVMSEDAMQSQVGPMVAARLSLPCVVASNGVTVDASKGAVTVVSELEGMLTQTVTVRLPALITVQSSVARPRYPSLSGILTAKEKRIRTIETGGLAEIALHEEYGVLAYPPLTAKGIIIDGESAEKADRLLTILHERSLLKCIAPGPGDERP